MTGTELKRTLLEDIFYPPHDPRKASSEYHRTHKKLVVEMDEPCWICGVRHSDVLKMPKAQQKLWQLETHHSELEWAAEKAFENYKDELARITADIVAIANDPVKLRNFLDSEGNMLVLCATHHRGSRTGIHMISYPAWKLQRWQTEHGWQFIVQPPKP
ncbi:MAG TPA: hypothetical protein VIY48_04145 [Candidatus Paceibacterota bacterium]